MLEPPGGRVQPGDEGKEVDLERLRTALGARYRVEREIGRGGRGTVYLATESASRRRVAVKVLHARTWSPTAAERCLRDIRAAKGLEHPHILPLLDSGVWEGIPYCVMPYVDEGALKDRLARKGPLSLCDVLRFTREIADALDAAHRQGVVHLDIKPANILLSDDHAVVADFGLVGAPDIGGEDSIGGAGAPTENVEYMSPEQAVGEGPGDERSDVYALGCLVYEMLAGKPPFAAASARAVIEKKLTRPVPCVSTTRELLPTEVDDVLKTALTRAPAERYATAGELAVALEGAVVRARTKAQRAFGSIRVLLAAAFAAAVLPAAALVAWHFAAPELAPVDDHRVVVFPLDDVRGGSEDGLLVAQLVEGVLEHAGSLEPVDAWSRLGPEGRADLSALGPEGKRSMALHQGARYYIAGRLVTVGDSLRVSMRVEDARGDSIVAQAAGAGLAGHPVEVGLATLMRLLSGWLGKGGELDLSPVRDRDPEALVSWTAGERAYRLGHFARARDLFRDAVGRDSLFGFAALKGVQASLWMEDRESATAFDRLAMEGIDLMPPKHRLLARGLHAYWQGRADSAVTDLRAALILDPEWKEAWAALGDAYLHLIPSDATDGTTARDAFMRASTLDPAFSPPLIHLAEFALRDGDLDLGSRLMATLARARPGEKVSEHLPLMRDCVSGELSAGEWTRAASSDPEVVLRAAKRLSEGGSRLSCAEAGFRALWETRSVPDTYRWTGALGLQAIYVAESRFDEAHAVLDSAPAWRGDAARRYVVVAALAGAPFDDDAKAWTQDLTTRFGPDLADAPSRERWTAAAWRARRGDEAGVRAVATAFPVKPGEESGGPDDLARQAVLARAAVASGRAEEALRTLASLSPAVSEWDLAWEPLLALPLERLLRARLLLRQGRPADALRVASVLDHPAPMSFLEFLPRSLELRWQAALAMDSVALAERYVVRLQALRPSDLP